MVRFQEMGKEMKRLRGSRLCLVSLAFLCACGCSTTNKNKGDPLLGEFGPKGDAKAPAKTSSNQVPPIPTASFGINNAVLAAGPFPGGRTLAINEPQPNPQIGPGALTAGAKDNPVLNNPQPVVQAVPKDNTPVVPAATWNNGQPPPPPLSNPQLTQQTSPANPLPGQPPPPDPLQAQLKAHGVAWQRAENVPGGVRVTCIVPNPQNQQISRTYEAIGPDYPAAARAVLWEIDNKH
jgi:hypothetical protein